MALQWTGALTPSLSEIDSQPLCYPVFPLVVLLRKCHRDEVNRLVSRCCDQVPCISIAIHPPRLKARYFVPIGRLHAAHTVVWVLRSLTTKLG